jgi:hypothetical protein
MKNLYKNEMLRYVSECGDGIVSFVELCMVYKEMNRSLGRKLNNKFIEKRDEKFCKNNNGVKVNEIEILGSVIKVKNVYKF